MVNDKRDKSQYNKLRDIFENLRKSLTESESSAYDMLETALVESVKITNCDGGTLYLKKTRFSEELTKPFEITDVFLSFEIMQNLTMNVLQRSDKLQIKIPPVPLVVDNKPNDKNVSAYCYNTNSIINVDDVYNNRQFDFSGAMKYDKQFNYRSKSMLVFPLKGRTKENIGVFQLINKKDENGELSIFSQDDEELMISISLIMGMVFSTQTLYTENTQLLDSLINMIAKNIEDKSPHTSEHIQRVTIFGGMIAKSLSDDNGGIYKNVTYDDEELEEIRKACLLHDIGKISIPEHVISKEVKLQEITDRMELIIDRYNSLYKDFEMEELKRKNAELESRLQNTDENGYQEYLSNCSVHNEALQNKKNELFKELNAIKKSNLGGEFLHDETIQTLNNAFKKEYSVVFKYSVSPTGEKVTDVAQSTEPESRSIFSADDSKNLMIFKGTLNDEERNIIQNHAQLTWELLLSLHLPVKLRGIALLAGSHHETLDGTGYPNNLTWKEMSLKMRIIAIADLLEALSSKSRPYRSPFKVTEFMNILGDMVKKGKIDGEILSVFVLSPQFSKFIQEYLVPYQMDEFDPKKWKDNFYIPPQIYEGEDSIKI